MGIGGWEILVILFVVLLVFGPKRIPEVSRGLGKGMREIRRVTTEFQRELNLEGDSERPTSPPALRPSSSKETPAPPLGDAGVARESRVGVEPTDASGRIP